MPLSPSHCRGRTPRPARRLPLCRPLSPRQVRRTRSARRPTPLSVRTCVWLLARLRTHFLGNLTGSSFTRPAQKGPAQPQKSDAAVRRPDPVCPVCPLVLLPPWVTGRQCARAAVARAAVTLCTGSRRAPIRGTPSLALRCARRRSASRAEISRTHYWQRSTAQRRRSRRPRTL
jgi:hypothetical protein